MNVFPHHHFPFISFHLTVVLVVALPPVPQDQACQTGSPRDRCVTCRPRPPWLNKDKNRHDTSCDTIEFDTRAQDPSMPC